MPPCSRFSRIVVCPQIHALQIHIEIFLIQTEGEHRRLTISNTLYGNARPWRGAYVTAYVGHKEEGNVERREMRCRGEEEEVVAEEEVELRRQ